MPYYSKAIILGHIGRDVETKFIPSGKALHTFSVAVSEKRGDDKATSWYTVNVWGDLIQWKLDELKKGALVMVAGRLSIRNWEKDEKHGTEVIITADSFDGVNVFGKKDEGLVSQPRGRAAVPPDDDDLPF